MRDSAKALQTDYPSDGPRIKRVRVASPPLPTQPDRTARPGEGGDTDMDADSVDPLRQPTAGGAPATLPRMDSDASTTTITSSTASLNLRGALGAGSTSSSSSTSLESMSGGRHGNPQVAKTTINTNLPSSSCSSSSSPTSANPLPTTPQSLSSPANYQNVDDPESLNLWQSFLTSYSRGDFPQHSPPPMPPIPASMESLLRAPPPSWHVTYDSPVYTSTQIDADLTREIREFYVINRYLPPPRAPLEALRERCIVEYNLYGERQRKNFQAAAELMAAFFPGTVTTFSLFHNRIQTHFALAGAPHLLERFQLAVDGQIPSEHSLCGHAVLLDDRNLFIPDLDKDWRWNNNPFKLAGFKSFIGASVALELDPASSPQIPEETNRSPSRMRVGIGTLNICFIESHLDELTPDKEKVLDHIARMLETQLRSTWEGESRTKEARTRRAISELIEEALVEAGDFSDAVSVGTGGTGTVGMKTPASERGGFDFFAPIGNVLGEASPVAPGLAGFTPGGIVGGAGATSSFAAAIAAGGAHMTSGFVASQSGSMSSGRRGSSHLAEDMSKSGQLAVDKICEIFEEVDTVQIVDLRSAVALADAPGGEARYAFSPDSPYPLQVCASRDRTSHGARSSFNPKDASQVILDLIQRPEFGTNFKEFGPTSGLEQSLPASTKCHLAMPFFADKDPVFIIIATSTLQHYGFQGGDDNIVRTIGSILRAQVVQTRVAQANAAKTAFLSSISHELRTPMHGVLTGLQLLKETTARREWGSIEQLLQVVEFSSKTLDRILNDVLEFGRVDRGMGSDLKATTVNLLESASTTALDCLGQMQGALSDLTIEFEDRDWDVSIDEAGYHRLIANGLSNAMKFGKHRPISLWLGTNSDHSQIIIRIIDQGIGIDSKSLGRLFLPFTKQNTFSPGVGLGLYLTKALVKRMGGRLDLKSKLGVGTTFEARLPVEFVQHPAGVAKGLGKRVISLDMARFDSEAATAPSPLPDPSTQNGSAEPLRVLVVDDNDISRRLLVRALKVSQTPVVLAEANDGTVAVKVFPEFKPHMVVTDVSMPGMDGLDAAVRMRALEHEMGLPRCQIFTHTGLGSSDPRMKAGGLKGDAQLDGWLSKGRDSVPTIRGLVAKAYQERFPAVE